MKQSRKVKLTLFTALIIGALITFFTGFTSPYDSITQEEYSSSIRKISIRKCGTEFIVNQMLLQLQKEMTEDKLKQQP